MSMYYNTGRGSDIIVLIEAGGFYSRKYGILAIVLLCSVVSSYIVDLCVMCFIQCVHS